MSDFMQQLQANQDKEAKRAQEQHLSELAQKIIAELGNTAIAVRFSILEKKRSAWLSSHNHSEYELSEVVESFDLYQPSMIPMVNDLAAGLLTPAHVYLEEYRAWLGKAKEDVEKHNNYIKMTSGLSKQSLDETLIGQRAAKEQLELNNIKQYIGYK